MITLFRTFPYQFQWNNSPFAIFVVWKFTQLPFNLNSISVESNKVTSRTTNRIVIIDCSWNKMMNFFSRWLIRLFFSFPFLASNHLLVVILCFRCDGNDVTDGSHQQTCTTFDQKPTTDYHSQHFPRFPKKIHFKRSRTRTRITTPPIQTRFSHPSNEYRQRERQHRIHSDVRRRNGANGRVKMASRLCSSQYPIE